MIQIVPAHTKKLVHAFAKFPFSLYRNHHYWVPPIIDAELASWDKSKNPVFDHAEADFFLAYKDDQLVGRVACIVNHTEVKQQGIAKMRFGWFDFIDDYQVSSALLNHVAEYGRQRGLAFMEGPVGFSNLDKVGVMTSGFDHIGTMITWYNHPYYADH
ncbi:MAG: GTP cyclohydrolase, partial [Flavobacteriaceae bacterium]